MNDLARRTLFQAAAAGSFVALFAQSARADDDGKVHVIAEIFAKPENADTLRGMLVPFAGGAAKEPGCMHYTLLEAEDKPGQFYTYEIWSDGDAFTAHLNTPSFKAAGPKIIPMLAQPLAINKLNKLVG
jgi:quinol monooxygenase YgiN